MAAGSAHGAHLQGRGLHHMWTAGILVEYNNGEAIPGNNCIH